MIFDLPTLAQSLEAIGGMVSAVVSNDCKLLEVQVAVEGEWKLSLAAGEVSLVREVDGVARRVAWCPAGVVRELAFWRASYDLLSGNLDTVLVNRLAADLAAHLTDDGVTDMAQHGPGDTRFGKKFFWDGYGLRDRPNHAWDWGNVGPPWNRAG